MNKIRLRYSKTGRAKYISHLDLTAVMQRAFIRAGVKLKYSEGFNPHPYISVALPLPVGCESICELMDVGIADETLPELKSLKLPEGITILDAYVPGHKFNDISWVSVNVNLDYENQQNDGIIKQLTEIFTADSILIKKRTKRGYNELDIAPFVKDIVFNREESIGFTAKISAQNPTINVDDLLNSLNDDLKPVYTSMKRMEIFDSNMNVFK